jgi:hypothetical protein
MTDSAAGLGEVRRDTPEVKTALLAVLMGGIWEIIFWMALPKPLPTGLKSGLWAGSCDSAWPAGGAGFARKRTQELSLEAANACTQRQPVDRSIGSGSRLVCSTPSHEHALGTIQQAPRYQYR